MIIIYEYSQTFTPKFTFIMLHSVLFHYGSFLLQCQHGYVGSLNKCPRQTPSGAMESYIFMSRPVDIVQPQCKYNFSKQLAIVYRKTIVYSQEKFDWVIIALQLAIIQTNLKKAFFQRCNHALTNPFSGEGEQFMRNGATVCQIYKNIIVVPKESVAIKTVLSAMEINNERMNNNDQIFKKISMKKYFLREEQVF